MWNLKQMRKDYSFIINECDISERDAIDDAESLDEVLLGKSKIIDALYDRLEDACSRCTTEGIRVDKIRERYGFSD